MKFLKKYKEYKESILIYSNILNIDESLSISTDNILSSIGSNEVDIYDAIKLQKDFYKDRMDIEFLSNNIDFINSLTSIALKKSPIQNSTDYQSFLITPCKFMIIYNIESNELENPKFIIIQNWNETLKKWSEAKLFSISDVNNFYNKLSSKTIEIIDGSDNYIYTSSNGANEWLLQNVTKENDTYKKVLRKEELQSIVDNKNVKINII